MQGENKFRASKKFFLNFLFFFILSLFFGAPAKALNSASLYLSPASGSYTVGQSFNVSIFVAAPTMAMNATGGTVSFPADKLSVVSLSKSGSIMSLWVQEPSFNNGAGKVTFEGVVLNPGFTGKSGKILTINFKIKSAGNISLAFSSGSVLANDGQGTNILGNLGSASFNVETAVTGPVAPKAETPPESAGTPAAPEVISSTHPDPNIWYSSKNPVFSWGLPAGVTGSRLLASETPQAVPNVSYIPAIGSKQLADVEDGIWYFHVRLANSYGWGGVTHFRFQIDSEKPSVFDIRQIENKDLTNPFAQFIFDAKDGTSGVDFYEVQIDEKPLETWRDDGEHIYKTDAMAPGKHILVAKAFDRAGNYLVNTMEFNILPLDPPKLLEYPTELKSGEIFLIKGESYPDSNVAIVLKRENDNPKEFTINTLSDGSFTFVAPERLKDGIYKMSAKVTDKRGAESDFSEEITVAIRQPALLKFGSLAISVFSIVIPLVALLLLLIFLLWYSWHKMRALKKKLKKDVVIAEEALHQAFDALKKDLSRQLEMLNRVSTKRQLTTVEKRISVRLKKDLEEAEKHVEKEIEDIENLTK